MKTGYCVGDAMTKEPICVSSEMTLSECCNVMNKNDVGSLLVKQNEKVKGILTDSDIISSAADGIDFSKAKASDIVYKSLPKVDPDMDIHDALIKMGELDLRQLPVFNNNSLVGMLTMKDILKIEPMLFEIVVAKMDIREEERKPIYKEGKCDVCGSHATDLMRQRHQLVCGSCRIF
ncbi:MAG: CBS domain-containing protein [Candidatus Woesearchaeota archaeon]